MPAGVEIGFEIEKKGGIEHLAGDSLKDLILFMLLL